MNTLVKQISCYSIFLAFLSITSPAIDTTEIEIDYDTASFKDEKITSKGAEVTVTYNKKEEFDELDNLHYQISYNGVSQLSSSAFTQFSGGVSLKDLDGNGMPEVVVRTFSGGAHCCNNYTVYTQQNNQLLKAEKGFLDIRGGSFQDLNRDEKLEFVSVDNSFLYAFSSYAGSFPPSQIYTFTNGKFENVTRRYTQHLKSHAWEMYQIFLQSKKEQYEVNGILAGYVAQKILLGEYEQGWKFMLANYDRTSDWGLSIYQEDREIGKYPNFPTALKAFLIQQGYLDKNGQPQ
ncbi:hypothetical protein [Gloeocapsopsis dulcis]|uniref:VCBS repeat-containing protein n=1 Tax=Gloeocapsopsis dulcis AAB1 = 1H9 TaxID=1433147 RepID=A0A6N8G1D0_9CHRO|nr:hypothetical protein [Gloeocapsopsis dulcis]MUL39208.1 hypothetical protein [Gloeocapsopsis dulcis AAB1 = 1H9]WNN90751.1 hypothetical protein P0S91_06650 [Gloeocapsopsis dulcis]